MKKIKDLTPINTLYEVERDGNLYYRVMHTQNNHGVEFDHNDNIVAAIENYIETSGQSLTLRRDRDTLQFRPRRKKKASSLSIDTFLYSIYSGISIEQARKISIQHICEKFVEAGIENCHKSNLASSDTPILKNRSREFSVITIGTHHYILLKLLTYQVDTLLDYSPEFLNFLAIPSNFTFIVNTAGYIQCASQKYKAKPYLHKIAFAFFSGLLNQDNIDHIGKILKEMSTYNGLRLQFDHLNDHKLNNCLFNLSMMPGFLNEMKHNAASLLKKHAHWAYDQRTGEYLLALSLTPVPQDFSAYTLYKFTSIPFLVNWLEYTSGIKLRDKRWQIPSQRNRDFISDAIVAQQLLHVNHTAPDTFEKWEVFRSHSGHRLPSMEDEFFPPIDFNAAPTDGTISVII